MPAAAIATRPIEPAMFDFQINNGAYVEIRAFNNAARAMMGGRSYIEERPENEAIQDLLVHAVANDASFMLDDGESMPAEDFTQHLREVFSLNEQEI